MFKIEYEEYGVEQQPIYKNDINDIRDILINIMNDERAERETIDWCCKATFGQHYINQKYKVEITCVYDETNIIPKNIINIKDKNVVQLLVDRISKETGYKNKFNYKKGYWYLYFDEIRLGDIVVRETDNKLVTVVYETNEKGVKKIKEWLSPASSNLTKDNIDKYLKVVIKGLNNYKEVKQNGLTKEGLIQRVHTLEKSGCIRNNDIVEIIKDANSLNIELRVKVYTHTCWELYIERHPYGQIRYWVKRATRWGTEEIKQVYPNIEGTDYVCDIKVLQAVVDKVLNSYRALKKTGLINN